MRELEPSSRRSLAPIIALAAWGMLQIAPVARGQDEDIDSLLNKANKVLHEQKGGPAAPSKKVPAAKGSAADADEANDTEDAAADSDTPATPAPKHGKHPKHKDKSAAAAPATPSPDQTAKEPTAPAPGQTTVKPLDQNSINNILAIDLQASEREKAQGQSAIFSHIAAGFDRFGTVYHFSKDDDNFNVDRPAMLEGIVAGADYHWALPPLNLTSIGLNQYPAALSAGFEGGFFQGDVQVDRSGVETYTQSYTYQVVPLTLSLGFDVSVTPTLELQASYGLGGEFLHQNGLGEEDTITDTALGDVVSFAISDQLTPLWRVFMTIERRGLGLFGRSRIDGDVFALGVGTKTAG